MKKDSGELKKICENGKVCFSEREALKTIKIAMKHHKHHGHDQIPKRAYYCSRCGCFHVSHFTSYQSQSTKNYNEKRQNLLEYEAEKLWRDEVRELSPYRINRC